MNHKKMASIIDSEIELKMLVSYTYKKRMMQLMNYLDLLLFCFLSTMLNAVFTPLRFDLHNFYSGNCILLYCNVKFRFCFI